MKVALAYPAPHYTVSPSFPRKNVTPYHDTGRESIGLAREDYWRITLN